MREGSEETDGRGGMEEGRIQRFGFFCFFLNAWRRKVHLDRVMHILGEKSQ